jgi:hypothetical protein
MFPLSCQLDHVSPIAMWDRAPPTLETRFFLPRSSSCIGHSCSWVLPPSISECDQPKACFLGRGKFAHKTDIHGVMPIIHSYLIMLYQLHINKPLSLKILVIKERRSKLVAGPKWVPDTKTDWLTVGHNIT